MNNPTSNADIQYLISMFEQQLDLLKDYDLKSNIDPVSRAYLHSFIQHVEQTKHTQNTHIMDFIDYGTKLMAYLSKNGVKGIEVKNEVLDQIMRDMITPEILKEPIMQAISYKIRNGGVKRDIELLQEALVQLQRNPTNYEKFKQKLSQIKQL